VDAADSSDRGADKIPFTRSLSLSKRMKTNGGFKLCWASTSSATVVILLRPLLFLMVAEASHRSRLLAGY
jgi:hypothetical protein